MQAEDGVLLEGRLSEYLQLFERCPSFEPDPGGGFGSINRSCVEALGRRLEHPLTSEEATSALESFCDGRECSVDAQRIGFSDFLNMFREHLLDLHQITEYMKLQDVPEPEFSPSDVRFCACFVRGCSQLQLLLLCMCAVAARHDRRCGCTPASV